MWPIWCCLVWARLDCVCFFGVGLFVVPAGIGITKRLLDITHIHRGRLGIGTYSMGSVTASRSRGIDLIACSHEVPK